MSRWTNKAGQRAYVCTECKILICECYGNAVLKLQSELGNQDAEIIVLKGSLLERDALIKELVEALDDSIITVDSRKEFFIEKWRKLISKASEQG